MIVTVTLNPAVDKVYWVDSLKMCDVTQEEFLTRAKRSSTSAGGKGINVSVFLARMGVESVAMGFVGGHTGHVVVRDLRDEGVTTNFVWIHGETRINVTLLQEGHEYSPNLIDEAGPTILPEEVDRLMRKFKRMMTRATWVVLGGSLPPGVDPGIYAEMVRMAKEAGAKVIVSARGEALALAIDAAPHIIKPDTRERLDIGGKEIRSVEDILDRGEELLRRGVELVVVSHDVTGDIAMTKEGSWEIRTSASVKSFKNLVGADDAFLAGILYKLAQEAPVTEAVQFGLAVGLASAKSDDKICQRMEQIEQETRSIGLREVGGGSREGP